MKKILKKAYCFVMALVLVMGCISITGLKTLAAETVDVTGTIKAGTTASMIYLNCDGSEMKIKIDDKTDLSECKVLLEGAKVTVSVYAGNDKYLHAAKVKSTGITTAAKVDGIVMISGNIKEGTTTSVIKLSTILGDYEIKYDNGTDLNDCKMIAIGRNILVTCGKDQSGALYATKISEGTNTTSSSSSSSASTTTITGKIASNSTSQVIYLKNDTGTMTIKVDSDTQVPNAVVLATDSTVSISVYTGSDKYLHAQKITQSRSANTYAVDSSKLYKVTGKVAEGSTTDTIKFDMGDGSVMNLKLDNATTCSEGIILTKDTKVTVTCGRGADAYMHAVKIEKAN